MSLLFFSPTVKHMLSKSTLSKASIVNLVRLAKYIGVDFSINTNAMNDKDTLAALIANKLGTLDPRWPPIIYERK